MRSRGHLTLIPLLRIPSLGPIGSTKLVLPKWQNIDILNRGIRVNRQTFQISYPAFNFSVETGPKLVTITLRIMISTKMIDIDVVKL